jgi:MFS family permease
LFALSAAVVHPLLGRLSSKGDNRFFLTVNSWGMACGLLFFPLIDSVYQVYLIQIIFGVFGAMQKHGEKMLVADYTDGADRGAKVGSYHFWTSVFAAVAIVIGGILADYFTIHLIFYLASFVFFVSGLFLLRTGGMQKAGHPPGS